MNMEHLPIYLCFLLFPLSTFHNFKRKIYQDNTGILNIDVSNTVAPNFIDDLLLAIKLQTVHNTVLVSCFNFPHSPINKSSGQNLNGETFAVERHPKRHLQNIPSKHWEMVCTQVPKESRKGPWASGARVPGSCEPPSMGLSRIQVLSLLSGPITPSFWCGSWG